ncbi:hypothetical protein ES707_04323 [subsurface metagenome]
MVFVQNENNTSESKTFIFWIYNSFFILTMFIELNTIVLTEISLILVISSTIKNPLEPIRTLSQIHYAFHLTDMLRNIIYFLLFIMNILRLSLLNICDMVV